MPRIFQMFTTYWNVPHRLALHWWRALAKSQWSRPRELRQQLLLFDATLLGGSDFLIATTCAPTKIIGAIEAQVDEGTLDRQAAAALENHILERVTRTGTWR